MSNLVTIVNNYMKTDSYKKLKNITDYMIENDNKIMNKYNFDGKINYSGLKDEPFLNEYLNLLSNTDVKNLKNNNEKIRNVK